MHCLAAVATYDQGLEWHVDRRLDFASDFAAAALADDLLMEVLKEEGEFLASRYHVAVHSILAVELENHIAPMGAALVGNDQVLADHAGEVVVISGHTNTVPDIIEEFGADPVPAIAENEYDNLYVVTVYRFNRAKVLHLNYGDPD